MIVKLYLLIIQNCTVEKDEDIQHLTHPLAQLGEQQRELLHLRFSANYGILPLGF
ncbi:MAG TPA: hypothetical protein PLL88_04125 [Anaerolineaceae bacterium]|nr:hypothetical protein [Anaerolineaceae bacterium]